MDSVCSANAPVIHHAIMEAAQPEGIAPKDANDIHTAEQAVHFVSERVGVAILTKTRRWR
jgi:hypothetical protein